MKTTGDLLRHKLAPLTIGSLGAAAGYLLVLRPWHLRWGATDEEIARVMPWDDQVKRPLTVTNRAVTINAPPRLIWPWLAQMGELPRGGFYSYDWIERLMGMKVSSAARLLPEHQRLEVGQALDRTGNMVVKALEPERFLVLGPPGRVAEVESTWTLGLYPIDGDRTRLVSRVRARVAPTARGIWLLLLLDPGQFLMERRMLLGIKTRVERPGSPIA